MPKSVRFNGTQANYIAIGTHCCCQHIYDLLAPFPETLEDGILRPHAYAYTTIIYFCLRPSLVVLSMFVTSVSPNRIRVPIPRCKSTLREKVEDLGLKRCTGVPNSWMA